MSPEAGEMLMGEIAPRLRVTIPKTVAYLAWFRALRLVPASMAATTVLVSPMVGVLLSTLVLGETLEPRQIVALGLTLTGVAIAARG